MKRFIVIAAMLASVAVSAKAEWKSHESREDRAGHASDFMKKRYDLSDDQAAKLEDAFKAQREAAKPLVDKLRIAQDQLQERVDSKASDKEVEAALSAVSSARAAVRAQREKFEASLASILTPTQRARMQLAVARRMELRRRGIRRGRTGKPERE